MGKHKRTTKEKKKGDYGSPHRYWVMDEDCQNLNVWTPGCDDAKRPVMVWLHGGGFEASSSIEQVAYEGESMSLQGQVVVVSINLRLNVLGYCDLSDFGEVWQSIWVLFLAEPCPAARQRFSIRMTSRESAKEYFGMEGKR